MTTPIIEHIATNIETAVNEITVVNGYNQILTAVRPRRAMFIDDTWDDLTVLISQAEEDEGRIATGAYGVKYINQRFELAAIIISSDAATAAIDTRINQVDSDIKKKLRIDPTRGAYAHDTIVMPSERFMVNESFTGIVVNVEIMYAIKEGDPYTKA